MTDVIFKESEPAHTESQNLFQEEVRSEKTSEQWLKAVSKFLDQFQKNVFMAINDYETGTFPNEHPTTHELAEYMNQSKATIQPRTSELKDAMVIEEAGKRPCTCSDCKHAREQKGKPKISVTTWKIRQVTE